MSTQTSNLGLIKPALTDNADISILNQNADKIDAAVPFKFGIENGIYGYYRGQTFIPFGGGSGGLPDEFQQVEYIESHGTEYIDTRIKPNNEMPFSIVFQTNSDAAPGYGNICGSRYESSNNEFQISCFTSGTVSIGTRNTGLSFFKNSKNTIVFGGNTTVTINGTEKTIQTSDFRNDLGSIILFGINQGAYPNIHVTQLQASKLYSCTFGSVRNFLPCYWKVDGTVGLYDTYGRIFFMNQGTGSFSKGPDVMG